MVASAAGVRISWGSLPDRVRRGVEDVLGDTVTTAVSQAGGFSPGTADRVVTARGGRAFVKAVHPDLNEATPDLHRREARVTAVLPGDVPAAHLLGLYDDGDWVALVLEDVEGRRPTTPWATDDLRSALAALDRVARAPLPAALSDLPGTAAELAHDLAGFDRLRADPDPHLDPWVRDHLDDLLALAARAPSALAGDQLVHSDVRADNMIVRSDGTTTLVDWPWATRGAAWCDVLALLLDVRLHDDAGTHDVDALLEAHSGGADTGDLDAVLAGFSGYFLDAARRPAPAGLPTLRAFQAAEGRAATGWLRQRLEGGA